MDDDSLIECTINLSVSDWSLSALDIEGDLPVPTSATTNHVVSCSDNESDDDYQHPSTQTSNFQALRIDDSVSSVFERLSVNKEEDSQALSSSLYLVECSDNESVRKSWSDSDQYPTAHASINGAFGDRASEIVVVVSSSDEEIVLLDSSECSESEKSEAIRPNRSEFIGPDRSGLSLMEKSYDDILPPTPTPQSAESVWYQQLSNKLTPHQLQREEVTGHLQHSNGEAHDDRQQAQEDLSNTPRSDDALPRQEQLKKTNLTLTVWPNNPQPVECVGDEQTFEEIILQQVNEYQLAGGDLYSGQSSPTLQKVTEDRPPPTREISDVALLSLPQPREDLEEIVRVICNISEECLLDAANKQAPKVVKLSQALDLPDTQSLLDFIADECRCYARTMFEIEPVNTLFDRLSQLSMNDIAVFESCILQSAHKAKRWVRYDEFLYDGSSQSVDRLVSYNLLQYFDDSNLTSLVPMLSFTEVVVTCQLLGYAPSADFDGMRAELFRSIEDKTMTEEAITAVKAACLKLVALQDSMRLATDMCFEMFVLPWKLTDKFYDTYSIIIQVDKFVKRLKSGKIRLVPVPRTDLDVCSNQNCHQLINLCQLKGCLADRVNEDLSTVANNIGSSMAVLDLACDLTLDDAMMRFLMTNLVHMTDEVLKEFFATDLTDDDSYLNASFYLSILINQSVAGFDRRAVWCRKQLKCAEKRYKGQFEGFLEILRPDVSAVERVVRSEVVAQMLPKKKTRLSREERSTIVERMRPVQHRQVQVLSGDVDNDVTGNWGQYRAVSTNRTTFVRRFGLIRAYGHSYPRGVQDSGLLLTNSVILAFWDVIYGETPGAFFSRYQSSPIDWGSQGFYDKRQSHLKSRLSKIQTQQPSELVAELQRVVDQFSNCRSLVHWNVITNNFPEMSSFLETLGTEKFASMAAYLLESWYERVIGFPDLTLWNPRTGALKFVGVKKTSDPVYPHQVLWLEKLTQTGLDAEECQIVTKLKETTTKKK